MEHTDWHDDIEQDLDRDLTRLANLAEDDHQRDPSKSATYYYNKRLNALLMHKSRRYRISERGQASPTSITAEAASPSKLHTIQLDKFDQLSAQVEELTRLLQNIVQERAQEKEEREKLRAECEDFRSELGRIAKMVDGKGEK